VIDFGYGAYLEPLDSSLDEYLREWRNDPRIWKWCRQFDTISDQAQARWRAAQDADPAIRMWAITQCGGAAVGVAGLTSIDHVNQRAEFSLYIEPDSQKIGIGRAALATMLSHGFKNLNLNVIWGEVFQGNPALLVFEHLGFVNEGTRRDFYFRDGKFIGAHLISMRRDEWIKRLPSLSWS
jgi:RimJ/RimL family protein N-acetyltransferase